MDVNSRVQHMDDELKLLKNEIKQVLLEVQEHLLNAQNPFVAQGGFAAQVNMQPQKAANPEPPPAPAPQPPPPVLPSAPLASSLGEPAPSQPYSPYTQGLGPTIVPVSVPFSATQEQPRPSDSAPAFSPMIEGGLGPQYQAANKPEEEYQPQRRQGTAAPRPEAHAPRREREDAHAPRREREEVMESPSPEPKKAASKKEKEKGLDLVTIAGLAQWSDRALRRMGKENFETLLQVSEMTGRISKEAKEVLLAMIPLFEGKDSRAGVSAKEFVSLLAQLDGLISTGPLGDVRMLSFMFQDDSDFLTLFKP